MVLRRHRCGDHSCGWYWWDQWWYNWVQCCQLGGGPEWWDALIAVLKHKGYINHIAFSQDSFHLASFGQEVKVWDTTSGAPVKTFSGNEITLTGDFLIV